MDVVKDVKRMYIEGLSIRQIRKELKAAEKPTPCPQTISAWVKKYKLNEGRVKLKEKTNEKLVETLAQVKQRHLATARETIAKYRSDLPKKDISAQDAKKWAEHELLIWGESTDAIDNRIEYIVKRVKADEDTDTIA
jgi:hypothetical protein